MGMDVYGIEPRTNIGEYFRNNVWYWHPLWNYCEIKHPEIALLVEHAHDNSGDGLNAEQAFDLGRLLLHDIRDGVAIEYETNYNEELDKLPLIKCDICKGSGIRHDELGIQEKHDLKPLSEEVAAKVNRTTGWCNGCDGLGEVKNFATHYHFDVNNLFDFALFLIDCGGFKIC